MAVRKKHYAIEVAGPASFEINQKLSRTYSLFNKLKLSQKTTIKKQIKETQILAHFSSLLLSF